MSSSPRLILYTQDNCQYCNMMKTKLKEWGYTWDECNLNKYPENKEFMKKQGHRTVPQLYHGNNHLNKVDTQDFTKEMLEENLGLDEFWR